MASSADKTTPPLPAQPGSIDGSTGGNQTGAPSSASFRTNDLQDSTPAKHSRPHLPPPSHSNSNSATNSPKSSREPSPVRPPVRPLASAGARPSRSRKNSQELSPNRNSHSSGPALLSTPSAAAVQRALSATNKTTIPTLQPSSSLDGSTDAGHAEKSASNRGGELVPHWPGSPRLKSPPPMSSSRGSASSPRRSLDEHTPSNTAVKRLAPPASEVPKPEKKNESENDDTAPRSIPRPTGRGVSGGSAVLETVEESSLPTPPAIGPGPGMSSNGAKQGGEGRPETIDENPLEDSISSLSKTTGGSGSESGGNKSSGSKADVKGGLKALTPSGSGRPAGLAPKRSHTALHAPKAKSTEGPVRSMTVETETVSSVPQVSLGGGAGERGASGRMDGGSVRLKPSNETIRPRKEKKRTSRKPPSITSGTASSKADIFEAKVATAVDEANSSDSEETFVYESNPPEHVTRPSRHHSRTPSATSMASQMDQYGSRYKQGHRDAGHSVHSKKSMKFTNSNYNNTLDGDPSIHASARGSTKAGGATARYHHIGRHGRGGGHASIIDGESPFQQPNKPGSPRTTNGNGPRHGSRPNSPRVANLRTPGSPRKGEGFLYDIETEGADDERTPLMGSVRINRDRRSRRPYSGSLRQVEYADLHERSFFSRYGPCVVVTLLLLILIIGAAAFVVALTKPLYEVSVKHIENVLASEQEVMLDLDVRATNPNLFAITVTDMDVNLFAKSGYVGSSQYWREHGPHPTPIPATPSPPPQTDGFTIRWPWSGSPGHKGVGEGNDPIDSPEGDPQTMLLGRIFEFDSPLTFDPSPLERKWTSSVGQLRLAKPGNETEEGGTARWERVIQHPFQLIVRGVIKYQLPLSSKMHSASIGSRIKVLPEEDDDANNPGSGKNKSRKAVLFSA